MVGHAFKILQQLKCQVYLKTATYMNIAENEKKSFVVNIREYE